MTRKRRRAHGDTLLSSSRKKAKYQSTDGPPGLVKTSVLTQYYGQVQSLRQYILAQLPEDTSKARRRKLANYDETTITPETQQAIEVGLENFSQFLDETLIGVKDTLIEPAPESRQIIQREWITFSQKTNATGSNSGTSAEDASRLQSEIVDFAIWLLFKKSKPRVGWASKHLLCQGFRNAPTHKSVDSLIPGLVITYPNSHVTSLKSRQWSQLLAMIGREGEAIMTSLIVDCGIYTSVPGEQGNYFQLSGLPLGDLKTVSQNENQRQNATQNIQFSSPYRSHSITKDLSSINIVRNRILYAKAAFNANGGVRFGLRHIHVLNRFPYETNSSNEIEIVTRQDCSTKHVAMYIFPRQFGLHNVFTSRTNSSETTQLLKDYTLREEEIAALLLSPGDNSSTRIENIPKRLRGEALALVRKLRILHSRCAYKKLLDEYCPKSVGKFETHFLAPSSCMHDSSTMKTQTTITSQIQDSSIVAANTLPTTGRKLSLLDSAVPDSQVAAFCRATMSKLVPKDFWGSGSEGRHNHGLFLKRIDEFVKMRRFESFSIHEILQGMKLSNISWLAKDNNVSNKSCQSDTRKRTEIFGEFIYYLFDSLLIPLIRTNFYVTESGSCKYRLFYFRHDVWRSITEPALASLKSDMFEEMTLEKAQEVLDVRSMGFSQIRLLPKESGVRPIMNLRRRSLKKGSKMVLDSSINSLLTPVYNALLYEKGALPTRLGSSLFSVGDMYPKIKAFLSRLGNSDRPLFFVKADVASAFDTIPQSGILRLALQLFNSPAYQILKHMEMKPGESRGLCSMPKPSRRWKASAHPAFETISFEQQLTEVLSNGQKNTVFVENIVPQTKDTRDLIALLVEHVQRNLVKIGKKFYRQKAGIPQGSILSSLLCNYFYADLEAEHFQFLQTGKNLLLRLIDDFLLITTDKDEARKFLQTMHDGLPEYGMKVNPAKTLANFEISINGIRIQRLVGHGLFPYCGSFIDTKTLNIIKHTDGNKHTDISNSLTVEYSRSVGHVFHRKTLNSFKIQAHAMYLDTRLNKHEVVLRTIYKCFLESAAKMCAYIKCLPFPKRPSTSLIIRTISDLQTLAYTLCKAKSRIPKNIQADYECCITNIQIEFLAFVAFKFECGKRQTGYREVLVWIRGELERLARGKNERVCKGLWRLTGKVQRGRGGMKWKDGMLITSTMAYHSRMRISD